MSFVESVGVALFTMLFVFLVLASLFAMITILSVAIRKTTGKMATGEDVGELSQPEDKEQDAHVIQSSSGELKLINVDEKTAAMIMAIVSDESKIPLSELCFKSIKAVE